LDDLLGEVAATAPDAAILVTADHGMNFKSRCWDLEKALQQRGAPVRIAISAERDRYLSHHQGLGGTAWVHLRSGADEARVGALLSELEGVERVLTRAQAAKESELMASRIGDLVVIGNRDTVFGNLDSEMEVLPADFRSHGSLDEINVPVILHNAPAAPPKAPGAGFRGPSSSESRGPHFRSNDLSHQSGFSPTPETKHAVAMTTRRLRARWRVERMRGGYVVRDANGQALAYLQPPDRDGRDAGQGVDRGRGAPRCGQYCTASGAADAEGMMHNRMGPAANAAEGSGKTLRRRLWLRRGRNPYPRIYATRFILPSYAHLAIGAVATPILKSSASIESHSRRARSAVS
jgi:hypothetical protein